MFFCVFVFINCFFLVSLQDESDGEEYVDVEATTQSPIEETTLAPHDPDEETLLNYDLLFSLDDDDLSHRKIPKWFSESRFGVFFSWQLYSVFGLEGRDFAWERWTIKDARMRKGVEDNYRPNFTYAELALDFGAEFYDPQELIKLADDVNAKYVVMTSKCADGYPLWRSKYSCLWNSYDLGPKRDLLGEFVKAASSANMTYGISYSFNEPTNPLFDFDRRNHWKTSAFPTARVLKEVRDVIGRFKPKIFWSEIPASIPATYFDTKNIFEWIVENYDSMAISNEWGKGSAIGKGGYAVYRRLEDLPLFVQKLPFEFRSNMNKKSSACRKDAVLDDFKTVKEMIRELAWTVSVGGNYVISVPLTPYGRVPPLCEERLRELGQWIGQHNEAIFNSTHYKIQKDPIENVWYTMHATKNTTFAFVLEWPKNDVLKLSLDPQEIQVVFLTGYAKELFWTKAGEGVLITFPSMTVSEFPSLHAWVLSID